MTLSEVYNILKIAGQAQPNINTIEDDFLKLNREDTVYSAFIIQQREHQRVGDFINYSFYIGYVDRLTDDKSNEVDIHSTGINVLNSIVNGIKESCYPTIDIAAGRYITFNQRFTAECAGVYTDVILSVPASDCPDFEFHFGGSDLRPAVFRSNGVYEPVGFDGYSKVTVQVEAGNLPYYIKDNSIDFEKLDKGRTHIDQFGVTVANDNGVGTSIVPEGILFEKEEKSILLNMNDASSIIMPSIKNVLPYFYEAEYARLDYDYANEHIGDPIYGGCTVVREGSRIGRNYDWKYDNKAEFFVRTYGAGRHTVIGICGGMRDLTAEFVDSGEYSDSYRLLPFNMLDGINDAGLYCSMNVVPATGGMAASGDICDTMAVRYILDRFSSVDEVVTALADIEIYNHPQMAAAGYEVHYYIADRNSGVCIEWKDGDMTVTHTDKLTNFHIAGVNFNADGSVYTPEMACFESVSPRMNNIEGFESGLERWNLIINSQDDLYFLIRKLYYTNAYRNDNPAWYSEFVGGDFDVNVGDFQILTHHILAAKEEYERRDRETGTTWHTVHSCIYDINRLTVTITVQEGMGTRTYALNDERYTNSQIDEMLAERVAEEEFDDYKSVVNTGLDRKVDKSSIWTGTEAQWNALTAAQKASYIIALIRA